MNQLKYVAIIAITFASLASASDLYSETCTGLTTKNTDGSYGIVCGQGSFCGAYVPTDVETKETFAKMSNLSRSEELFCFESSRLQIGDNVIHFAFSLTQE
jgi:hypothetical protein